MNDTPTSQAYQRAIAEHDAAMAKFHQIRDDYRAGFTPASGDPKWQAIVARCCRFGS